jgi:hypothetical protein
MGKHVRNVHVKRKQGEVIKPGLNILQQAYSNRDPRGDTECYWRIHLLQEFTFFFGCEVVNGRPIMFLDASANFGNNFQNNPPYGKQDTADKALSSQSALSVRLMTTTRTQCVA